MNGSIDVGLDDVRFRYADAEMAFDTLFPAGNVTAVMGPSGSGKSTLLNLVAGFESPDSGKVTFGDVDLTGATPSQRPVSMVFQENNLFSHLTVADNVGLGISPSLRLTADDRALVERALQQTGLAGKEKRLPRELSGGERQRVALARVLVRNRPVLLLDEPFASLGPALREDMVGLLRQLQADRPMTVLFVTHQPEDAARIADTVVFLDEGRIAAQGPASAFFGPTPPEIFRRYVGGAQGLKARQLHPVAAKPT